MWRQVSSGPTNLALKSHGSTETFPIIRQSIDPCVTDPTKGGTGQTARVLGNNHFDDWVEAGYREKPAPCQHPQDYFDPTSVHCFDFFTEWGLDGTHHDQQRYPGDPIPCARPDGRLVTFRIELPIPWFWRGLYDCRDGQGWHVMNVNPGPNGEVPPFNQGSAQGEGFERNTQGYAHPAQTSMAGETHSSLQYMDASNTWQSASSVQCQYDDDWWWDGVSGTGPSWSFTWAFWSHCWN